MGLLEDSETSEVGDTEMRSPDEFLSAKQFTVLRKIHGLMEGFWGDNDNPYTYALTSVIRELTSGDFISPEYLTEKLNILFRELDLSWRLALIPKEEVKT